MQNFSQKISTSNHEDIKGWAELRSGRPVRRVQSFEGETLRDRIKFRFPDEKYPNEEDLSWGEFFNIFDQEKLQFVFEDVADEAVEQTNIYQFEPRKY